MLRGSVQIVAWRAKCVCGGKKEACVCLSGILDFSSLMRWHWFARVGPLVCGTKNMPPQPTEIAALLIQNVMELSEARVAYVARVKQAVLNLQFALGM